MTDDIVKLPVDAALAPGLQIDPHVLHDMLRRRRTRRRRWIAEVADPAAAKRKIAALGARLRGRRWQAELRIDRGEDARAQIAEVAREAGGELVALREPRPVAPPQEGRPRPATILPRGAWLPERVPGHDGTGIAIGVVDFGFRYDHETFRCPDGRSRIAWLWDQNPVGRGPDPLDGIPDHPFSAGYGVVHSRAEIDRWLATGVGPYDPEADYYDPALLKLGLHGTHVASLAAGSPFKVIDSRGNERTFAGVAPGAELYLVQLGVSRSDFAEPPVPASLAGTTAPPAPRALSDNTRLCDAVHWIIARAIADGRRGVVINLSLATHAGAHDGRSMVESEIDRLIEAVERGGAAMPMIAVVICAGNAGDARAHAAVPLAPGESGSFGWEIQPLDEDLSEIELWHDPAASIEVTLHAPPHLARLGFGPWLLAPTDGVPGRWLRGPEPERAAFGWWSNTRHRGNARPACIGVRIDPGLDNDWDRARRLNGVWSFALRHAGGPPAELHAWVEREYGPAPARVAPPPSALRAAYARSTLGSLCCGRHSIVVGAAFQAPTSRLGFRPSANSGAGPRPWQPPPLDWSETDDPARPHLCAVGVAAVGAGGRGRDDAAVMDGTSQAAPQVAGALALMMQAVPEGRRLSAHELRAALIAAARARPLHDPGDRSDLIAAERAGAGLLNAEGAVALIADAVSA
ncbi:S8 family serine peptidase [Elioraea tepidiphila]|uniref:S8 family serine peptidase n=1 Tax=Elioraea tepidiphila TaxID=457934 RepID=UPI002FD8C0D1